MLSTIRPAIVAACLGFAALVVANYALANDPSSSDKSGQGQQAQPSQPAQDQQTSSNQQSNPQLNLPATDQQKQSAQQNQQQPSDQSSIRNEGTAAPGARSTPQQPSPQQKQSGNQPTNAANPNAPEWPAPQRYEYRRPSDSSSAERGSDRSSQSGNQPSGRRRASLGVNIIGDEGQGITVLRIQPNTAAQRMGLRARDRIINLNGQPINSADDFIAAIGSMNPGDQIELTIDRGGNTRTIRGTLQAYSESITRIEGPLGRIRGFIGREQGPSQPDLASEDQLANNPNVQTSYEDRQSSRAGSSDTEARLSRLEQQLDRLTRDIQELRNNAGSPQQPPAQQPAARQPGETSPQPPSR